MQQKFIDIGSSQYVPVTVLVDAVGNPYIASGGSTPTDRSGTITLGGTAQTGVVANTSRKRYKIMNIDTTIFETLWYRDDGGDAVIGGVGSWPLAPSDANGIGGFAQGFSTAKISVISATTGHK